MALKQPELVDLQVGNLIKLRRQQKGMSQTDLGIAIGVSFQQLQKYERGSNRISASRLQLVAHILKVPVSYFFENSQVSSPKIVADKGWPAEIEKFFETHDGRSLASGLMRIKNIRLRKSICKLVEQLAVEGRE